LSFSEFQETKHPDPERDLDRLGNRSVGEVLSRLNSAKNMSEEETSSTYVSGVAGATKNIQLLAYVNKLGIGAGILYMAAFPAVSYRLARACILGVPNCEDAQSMRFLNGQYGFTRFS
jgi:hypothetical protein